MGVMLVGREPATKLQLELAHPLPGQAPIVAPIWGQTCFCPQPFPPFRARIGLAETAVNSCWQSLGASSCPLEGANTGFHCL